MINARKLLAAVAAVAVTAGVAGCGEDEQVILYKQGKYQGKADTRPWDNDAGGVAGSASKWTKGDKSGWEAALKSRAQNQNEYTRAE